MRSLFLPALAIVALSLTACPSNEPELGSPGGPLAEAPQGQPAELLSSVHMADPRATAQLLGGFYGLEQGAWRWTARKFSVALKPPPVAEGEGAHLELKLTLPDAVIDRQKSLTLSATANGAALGSETFSKPGDYVFAKPVPPEALTGEAVKVEFELDKALGPGESDQRELGLVAASVALK